MLRKFWDSIFDGRPFEEMEKRRNRKNVTQEHSLINLQMSSWQWTSLSSTLTILTGAREKKELDNRGWERMGQRTNERRTHRCVVCERACMDVEELGIGLQQLFGLKCLRSDLVFIVMYLLFVFFFLFAFLFYRLLFWQVTACTNSRLSELEIWKVFNINPSSCNLIVLLLFLTISLLHTFFSDKLLTLHYCFFF